LRHLATKDMAALHSAVLLFALSGLFGKWLTLPAFYIVAGRACFAAVVILVLLKLTHQLRFNYSAKQYGGFALTGALLAAHWTSFFYAIQVSTVTIGLITFACFPLMVSLIEPWFFKERFRWQMIAQAILVLAGIVLVVPISDVPIGYQLGLATGLLSALTFALLTIVNRSLVNRHSAHAIAGWQNGFAALWLMPLVLLFPVEISAEQLTYLAILGIVFTALSHSLFNFALKSITAHMASIAVSLEPIYGILAAIVLLDERVTALMVLGGGLVILANIWALKPVTQLN